MCNSKRNHMQVRFDARSVNESFARMAVAAFMADLNPTIEQLADVKTAVSEAVTNAIVHGYADEEKQVELTCEYENERLSISISDDGVGIENVEEAMQPFFTSKPGEERTGMGFAFMEAFMDEVHVESKPGAGTTVHMVKRLERTDER